MNQATDQQPAQGHNQEQHPINIQIDRVHYTVETASMSGEQLRQLGGVAADRDLFRVVPGGTDTKIAPTDTVQLKSGDRFFTAPGQINPGA
jgi:hypothetical protein